MERILYSSSPSPLRLSRKPSPFLPRLIRFDSPKLILPPLIRPEFRRVSSISRKKENPFEVYCSRSNPRNYLPPLPSPGVNSANLCRPNLNGPKLIPVESSKHKKAITAGTFLVLSAIIAFLVQPVFAPAALATFPDMAKTHGSTAVTAGTKLIHTELLNGAWTGFLAGCLHTLSGPDHLAALAPLSIGRSRMQSALVGALWGCGHDAGQVIFGLIFLLLKDRLHIEIIRTWGTRVVGLTLLVIGAIGIKEASELHAPRVALESGGERDVGAFEALKSPEVGRKKVAFATFATGIIHGLQPDALMMVLPALALPSHWAGAAFLIMFLVGTVVAMSSYTVLIGSCSEALKERVPRITEKLTWASSLVAIGLGIAILVSQLFGYSLY